jgi:tRNA threonylcarbamoyladenosine biosynthesis protein TsaB
VIVLAVESATELAGVALADETGVLATATVSRGRHHAESIAPAIEFVCRRAGVRLSALDAVGVDIGPGLFTGLRVGVGTAKALAFALERPLVGVSSLEVLAHAVATSGVVVGTLVVPVVDARRGEVFVARLRTTASGVSSEGEEVRRAPDVLAAELAGLDEPFVLTGDGASRYRSTLGALPGAVMTAPGLDCPAPGVLAMMALSRAASGQGHDSAAVLPRYLRDADTRIKWETRTRRAGVGG